MAVAGEVQGHRLWHRGNCAVGEWWADCWCAPVCCQLQRQADFISNHWRESCNESSGVRECSAVWNRPAAAVTDRAYFGRWHWQWNWRLIWLVAMMHLNWCACHCIQLLLLLLLVCFSRDHSRFSLVPREGFPKNLWRLLVRKVYRPDALHPTNGIKFISDSLFLYLRLNGHFPGEPGLAGVSWSKGWWRWWVVTTGLQEL